MGYPPSTMFSIHMIEHMTLNMFVPVLLVLGLGGRFAALGLSVVNVVAVISLMEIAPAAFQQHVFWGSLLAALAIYGPGSWSLERLVWPRLVTS